MPATMETPSVLCGRNKTLGDVIAGDNRKQVRALAIVGALFFLPPSLHNNA